MFEVGFDEEKQFNAEFNDDNEFDTGFDETMILSVGGTAINVDQTLSVAGDAADAKVVGDAFVEVNNAFVEIGNSFAGVNNAFVEAGNILAKKTEKTRIDFDGSVFKLNGSTLNYKQLHDIHLNNPDFAFIVYGDRAYLLSYVQDDTSAMRELRFESSIATQTAVKTSGIYVTSTNGIDIAGVSVRDINSENQGNKVSEITESNKNSTVLYPSNAAISKAIKTDPTLSIPGVPADAAATGQALSSAFENLYVLSDDISGYITTSGSVAAASSTQVERTSDFISVKAGELYTVQVFQEGSNQPWLAMAAFDSSYQFVSRIVGSSLPTYSERTDEFGNLIPKTVFEVPDGIAYIRISARTYNGTISVIKGSVAPPNFRFSKKDERLRSNPNMYSNFTPSKPRIILHRGYNMLAPEESIPAYIKGGKAGAWGMECDVQITKDGKFVLMHDSTVDRMTNGSGKISELTLQQIREFRIDVGAGIETLSDNEKIIPTLEEYLRICKYYGSVAVIEMKWNMTQAQVREMVNAIRLFNMQDSCIIISFLAKDLKLVNLTAPEIAIGFMPANDFSNIEDAGTLSNLIINVNQYYVNQQLVDSLHVSGILVGSWSTGSEGRITELAALGVDFITIDEHPNVLCRQNDGWELKGTITTDSKEANVDLTGCTELIVNGTVTAEGGATSLINDTGAGDYLILLLNIAQSNTRSWVAHWKDWPNGVECISAKYSSQGGTAHWLNGDGCSTSPGLKIGKLSRIRFNHPEYVASCDLKIYSR